MKRIQVVDWREYGVKFWRFGFLKGDPLKQPAAFHLIYKWSLWFAFIEIRKFMTDEEMRIALRIYVRNETKPN